MKFLLSASLLLSSISSFASCNIKYLDVFADKAETKEVVTQKLIEKGYTLDKSLDGMIVVIGMQTGHQDYTRQYGRIETKGLDISSRLFNAGEFTAEAVNNFRTDLSVSKNTIIVITSGDKDLFSQSKNISVLSDSDAITKKLVKSFPSCDSLNE